MQVTAGSSYRRPGQLPRVQNGHRGARRCIFLCVVSSYSANIKYKLSPKCFEPSIGSGVSALSQHTAHSLAHPDNSPGTHMFCVSSRGQSRDSVKCCCCSLRVYLLFGKFSFLMHRFVSAIHFTAAVQCNFSAVGLIKDYLILSCKGRELTVQCLEHKHTKLC